MLERARRNPRTTLAGVVGFVSLIGGIFASYQGGLWWPAILGVALKAAADAVGHALAADAGAPTRSGG